MTVRRAQPVLALALALLTAALAAHWIPARADSVPTSVALVYPKAKLFRPGDWVLYQVRTQDADGRPLTVFQRIQIGTTMVLRGENCFWLETGMGHSPDTLSKSAVLVSEGLFEDDKADLWPNYYVRMMHMETDKSGVAWAAEVRTVNPKAAFPPDSLGPQQTSADLGVDTLHTAKGPIVCQVVEVTRIHRAARDLPDSTEQNVTETTDKRWMSLHTIPISGLVKEQETKVYKERIWPLGKPSTQFPFRIMATTQSEVEMVDFGHGAKPMISDRIRPMADRRYMPPDLDE
jgi:hypothetical protein